jgi:hypothetical protein
MSYAFGTCTTVPKVKTFKTRSKQSSIPPPLDRRFWSPLTKISVPAGFSINGGDWSAYQTFVPGALVYKLFKAHGADLFSANVRDYLGSREADANINKSIKETAESHPENFWVYNNGITALVNDLTVAKKAANHTLTIRGISIVNGAQTTGAIGSLDIPPSKNLMVPIRFIWTPNKNRVQNIVRFNNS